MSEKFYDYDPIKGVAMAQSLFEEIGFDKVSEIMAAATAKASKRADQLGLPHAKEIDGKWVLCYPDGSSKSFPSSGADPLPH